MVYKPKTGEETLKEPPLNLERSAITSEQQLDARSRGYFNEAQRILRKLKKRCFKSFKAYHDTKMDLFMPC